MVLHCFVENDSRSVWRRHVAIASADLIHLGRIHHYKSDIAIIDVFYRTDHDCRLFSIQNSIRFYLVSIYEYIQLFAAAIVS